MTTLELPQITDPNVQRWLNGLAHFDAQNENMLFAIFSVFGQPASLLDVGSGDGAMVNMARKIGVEAYGLDILPRPLWPHLIQHDLRLPYDFGRTFGMVISIETAEHIDPDYTDVYLDTIARHITRKGVLIFSAAMPGQPGDGHVQLQQALWWRERLERRGLHWWGEWTYKLALALMVCNNSQHHVEANLQVFAR